MAGWDESSGRQICWHPLRDRQGLKGQGCLCLGWTKPSEEGPEAEGEGGREEAPAPSSDETVPSLTYGTSLCSPACFSTNLHFRTHTHTPLHQGSGVGVKQRPSLGTA